MAINKLEVKIHDRGYSGGCPELRMSLWSPGRVLVAIATKKPKADDKQPDEEDVICVEVSRDELANALSLVEQAEYPSEMDDPDPCQGCGRP